MIKLCESERAIESARLQIHNLKSAPQNEKETFAFYKEDWKKTFLESHFQTFLEKSKAKPSAKNARGRKLIKFFLCKALSTLWLSFNYKSFSKCLYVVYLP